jgi:zinc protease
MRARLVILRLSAMKRWFGLLVAIVSIATLLAQDKDKPAAASTASAAPAEKKSGADTKNLPSARAVIDRYIEAAGGKEAFKKVDSVLIKAKTEVGGKDLGGAMTLATAKPNKLLLTVDLGGIAIRSGFDGKVGWQMNPLTGPSIMEGAELRDMARQSDFFAILHEDQGYKSMENLGKADFEGEECYKLKLVDADGQETTEYYSVKTGLQVGFTGSQESQFGKITATSVNNEHKKFGDLLLPSKVTQKMAGAGLSQTMIIDSVEYNNVPDSTFALPAEIKALLNSAPKKEDKKDEPAPAPATKAKAT